MDRVEQYIEDHTRKFSNECGGFVEGVYHHNSYSPWLTPDHAREVAEIARQEVIDKACEWLENFCNEHYIMSYSDSNEVETKELMEIFIKKMEE